MANAGLFGSIPGFDLYKGGFFNRDKYKFRDFKDGTSNTLAFGETLGHTSVTGDLEYAHVWIATGFMTTAWGMGDEGAPISTATYNRYSSAHPGIIQFALVDGSVRNISENIDDATFRLHLSGMADGNVVGEF